MVSVGFLYCPASCPPGTDSWTGPQICPGRSVLARWAFSNPGCASLGMLPGAAASSSSWKRPLRSLTLISHSVDPVDVVLLLPCLGGPPPPVVSGQRKQRVFRVRVNLNSHFKPDRQFWVRNFPPEQGWNCSISFWLLVGPLGIRTLTPASVCAICGFSSLEALRVFPGKPFF